MQISHESTVKELPEKQGEMPCRTRSKALCLVLLTGLVIAGCSSGGGDDEDEEGFTLEDADASGIWTGTDARDGGSTVPVTIIASGNGRFVSVSAGLFLLGNGSTNANSFSATGNGWPPAGETFSNGATTGSFSLTGQVFERSSVSGSYSGANESGTLSASYDSNRSDKGASLALIDGSYSSSGGTAVAITGGVLTLNSPAGPNCTGNGSVEIDDPNRNVYRWSMTLTGCDVNGTAIGVGYLSDVAPGSNNRVNLLGATTSTPVVIVASK